MARGRAPQPKEAEDTFAVRSLFLRLRPLPVQLPLRYGRVKAKPPSAVRFAQP